MFIVLFSESEMQNGMISPMDRDKTKGKTVLDEEEKNPFIIIIILNGDY